MKVHKGTAVLAGAAAIALALAACSGSSSGGGGGTGGSTGGNTGGNTGSSGGSTGGGSGSSSSVSPTSGTAGTGAFSDCATKPLDCNSGATKSGGTVVYTIEKTISGWNVNTAASNTFDYAEILDGILSTVYLGTPDLKATLNPNLMVSAKQVKANPQTIVYKINPDAVWDDGSPVNADDFIYQWQTQSAKICPKCGAASTTGYDNIKSVKGSDNGKTVTMVFAKPFVDWQALFGPMYPAHIAKKHGDDGSAAGLAASFTWFDKNQPTYSAGPYKISNYTKDTSVTLAPNPKWYGKTKPSLDKLVFRIITDQTAETTALQSGEVQVIYPQPSQDLVNAAKAVPDVNTYLGKGLVWEHLDLNTKNQFLSDKQLRLAVFTAISRSDIIARGVGQFVPGIQPLGNHVYLPGQAGYEDNVGSDGQGTGDVDKAKSILTAAGYTGVGSDLKTKDGKTVTFRCSYSDGNTLRQQTCQIVQTELASLGIKITLKAVPDLSILDEHDFDMVIFAWVGTPFPTSGAYGILRSGQGGNYTQNVDPVADKAFDAALAETDPSKIPALNNAADKAIEADAVELPLFQKPTFLAAKNDIVNIRDNATNFGPPYNVEEWGLKS